MTIPGSQAVPLQRIQVVVGALIVGLLAFLGVTIFLAEERLGGVSPGGDDSLWLAVLSLFGLGVVAGVFVLGGVMIRQARSRLRGLPAPERDELLRSYFPFVMVRCALIEGFGFFGAVVFQVSGSQLGLLASIAGIAGLVLIFPTRARFRSYSDRLEGGPL